MPNKSTPAKHRTTNYRLTRVNGVWAWRAQSLRKSRVDLVERVIPAWSP